MNAPLEQNTQLEQKPVTFLEAISEKTIDNVLRVETKKTLIPMYAMLFAYLMIPILSVEGIIGWSIGAIGAYKTINIYRSTDEKKTKKALKYLVLYTSFAVIYNILVYYVSKIIVSKVV